MPEWWAGLASDPKRLTLIGSGVAFALAAAFLLSSFFRKVPTAAEFERRRRTEINRNGKLGDAEVIDVEGVAVVYSYHVAGVGYTASQDVSALESMLPEDLSSMIGPAAVKFDRRNPANSIVISEEWNGLRRREKKL